MELFVCRWINYLTWVDIFESPVLFTFLLVLFIAYIILTFWFSITCIKSLKNVCNWRSGMRLGHQENMSMQCIPP